MSLWVRVEEGVYRLADFDWRFFTGHVYRDSRHHSWAAVLYGFRLSHHPLVGHFANAQQGMLAIEEKLVDLMLREPGATS